MHLSGRASWWLPRWLGRTLPHLSIEPAIEQPARAAEPPASAGQHGDRVPLPAVAAGSALVSRGGKPG